MLWLVSVKVHLKIGEGSRCLVYYIIAWKCEHWRDFYHHSSQEIDREFDTSLWSLWVLDTQLIWFQLFLRVASNLDLQIPVWLVDFDNAFAFDVVLKYYCIAVGEAIICVRQNAEFCAGTCWKYCSCLPEHSSGKTSLCREVTRIGLVHFYFELKWGALATRHTPGRKLNIINVSV